MLSDRERGRTVRSQVQVGGNPRCGQTHRDGYIVGPAQARAAARRQFSSGGNEPSPAGAPGAAAQAVRLDSARINLKEEAAPEVARPRRVRRLTTKPQQVQRTLSLSRL